MTTHFNLVQEVTNWDEHDLSRDDRLESLQAGETQAKQRKHEAAAERYCPSPELLNAINAALVTRTPLLLTGEAGTGKTQVAWFLARYFQVKLFEYQVHSNTQAKDMRYDFDAVAYLGDAYLAQHRDKAHNQETDKTEDPRSSPRYLKKGVLWKAYEQTEPCVLLIDEVDKAPRDFPNDLLQELDQNRFAHPFNKDANDQPEEVSCDSAPPIIILTSNGERRLPDAFLRRCMVHQIKLDNSLLQAILSSWEGQFPVVNTKEQQAELQQEALTVFNQIRSLSLSKKPGTAELLLWISVLSAQGTTAEALKHPIPALACLIKDNGDYSQVTDFYEQRAST